MRNMFGVATAALVLSGFAAQAGGLDKSGQSMGALFEKGRYMELSLGSVSPSVSGKDSALFGGLATGDVANDYLQMGFAYKADINDKLSYAIIIDQPFGADVLYSSGIALNGTMAKAEATAATVMLRYKLADRVSVHGGLRAQKSNAEITLRGAAYGPASGYNVKFDDDIGLGYSVGGAYEIPDIALRVAVTYNSAITHDFVSTENIAPTTSITKVKTPQSINVDFQSGIAQNTLLFGQIRWAEWSSFKVKPTVFNRDLVDLDDTITYSLGIGRKFNDSWSGAFSMSYERAIDPLVSPLAPTDGRLGAMIAAIYTTGNVKVTTGVSYVRLGDATPVTAGTPRASMTGSSALGVGVKVGFTF